MSFLREENGHVVNNGKAPMLFHNFTWIFQKGHKHHAFDTYEKGYIPCDTF